MTDDMDDVLGELRLEFVTTQLRTRIDALAQLVANAGSSEDARDRARRAAHMLRGTSGSYGLTALSDALAPLETTLQSPLDPRSGLASVKALFDASHVLAREILRQYNA